MNTFASPYEVSLNLPAGSQPEVPRPRTVRTSYGQFKVTYETAGGRIICRRQLILNAMRVTPDKYLEYRHFLADVAKAERVALIVHMPGGTQTESTESEAASK